MKMCRNVWLLVLSVGIVWSFMVGMPSTAFAQAGASAAVAETTPEPVGADSSASADNWADFVARTKKPAPWFTWGGDVRLRETYATATTTIADAHFQRFRTRLWATITPIEDIDLNFRLVYEPRHVCKPDSSDSWVNNEALFDIFNVTWRNAFGQPLRFVIGRQDIFLGDGWLVAEGTPEDGSRTTFFDAVRATYELRDVNTVIDAIYVDQSATADRWFDPFCNKRVPLIGQDERGGLVWVQNKSLKNTEINGFFIYKHDMRASARRVGNAVGYSGNSYTYGGRIVHDFNDNLQFAGDIAQQLGDRNGNTLCAWGANTKLTYFMRDEYDNQIRIGYEYLSGDKPGTGTDESFSAPWGRWARLGDLASYMFTGESRIADHTNMHRLQAGWSIKPVEQLELALDYHLLFADQNTLRDSRTYSRKGAFRGQLGTATLKYKLNQHVSGHLTGEVFCPGNYYSSNNNDAEFFLRYELVLTW